MKKGAGLLRSVGDIGNEISYQVRTLLPSNILQIALIGLDKSGKTTILYRIFLNEFIHTVPTVGFNSECIKSKAGTSKGHSFKFWDVGGQEKIRPLWKSYTRAADAVIFVADSTNPDRFDEARCELLKVARSEENKGVPMLVIANKQDLRSAHTLEKMEEVLGLSDVRSHQHKCEIIESCGITGEGLDEVLDILWDMIEKRRKLLKQQKKKGR